jgi:hypothetical protein
MATVTKKKSFGTKVCDILHFWENKRSNQLQVFANDPYLKDSKWLTSGSFTLLITKFNNSTEVKDQFNAIKLTFAEASELYVRLGQALKDSIEKEKAISPF